MIFGKRRGPALPPAAEPPSRTPAGTTDVDEFVPLGMRVAGAWAWRVLALLAVAAVFVFLVIQLRLIVIPIMISILLAALLVPLVQFLQRHRWPKGLAVAVAEVGLIAVVTGLVVLVVTQIRSDLPELQARAVTAFEELTLFLSQPPLSVSQTDIDGYIAQGSSLLEANGDPIVSGVLSVGSTAGHAAAGLLLTLFANLFLLIDGRGIWNWFVRLFPRRARAAVDGSATAGWVTLTTFVRVQIFVAAVDAIGIGLGAWILGLFFGGFPLVVPIAIAVFLGSFIPVVGAVLSGALAVVIALIFLNPLAALLMLGIVLLVQQIEGHVLQPLIMGAAVKVHPLAVVVAVAAGGFLAGIPGALFAVPVVATVNVIVKYMASGAWRITTEPDERDLRLNA